MDNLAAREFWIGGKKQTQQTDLQKLIQPQISLGKKDEITSQLTQRQHVIITQHFVLILSYF